MQDSLADRLSKEKPRNHIDARHRLDKDGNRYGKVIEFGQSELRVIELLETLCDSVKKLYELADGPSSEDSPDDSNLHWVKIGTAGIRQRHIPSEQKTAELRTLANYCGAFIEQHEDEIVGKVIRSGSLDLGEFNDLLCGTIGKQCSAPAGQDPWLLDAEKESGDDTAVADEL